MRRSQRSRRHLLRDAEGATAVEFAIVLPVFLLLICGIMDFGNVYYKMHIVSEASREGARRLAIDPSADVTTFIHTNYGSQLNVDATPAAPKNDVTVTVSDPVQIMTPIIRPFFASNAAYADGVLTITGKTVMRAE